MPTRSYNAVSGDLVVRAFIREFHVTGIHEPTTCVPPFDELVLRPRELLAASIDAAVAGKMGVATVMGFNQDGDLVHARCWVDWLNLLLVPRAHHWNTLCQHCVAGRFVFLS